MIICVFDQPYYMVVGSTVGDKISVSFVSIFKIVPTGFGRFSWKKSMYFSVFFYAESTKWDTYQSVISLENS